MTYNHYMHVLEKLQCHYSINTQLESKNIISQMLLLNKEIPRLCQKLKLKTDSP